tara:strand:+ start:213 stop:467 length:255 start_codon:yes stop_codon:yes gene_type:complete
MKNDPLLINALKNLKALDTLPEDVTTAVQSFVEACEAMLEYDIDHIPTEYVVKLIESLGKYPRYRPIANHIAMVILQDLGYFNK